MLVIFWLYYILYMNTFVPCRLCRNSKYPGYVYRESQKTYIECSCHKRWREKQKLLEKILKSNFSPDDLRENFQYLGTQSVANFEKIKNIFIPYFERFKGQIIYLHGPNGNQKTTVAKFAGVEIIKKGYKAYYILMQNLIKILTILEDREKTEKMKPLLDSDLLIIDESFDKSKVTIYKSQYQIPFLDSFLREFVDQYKKTILFVSNVPPSKISKEDFGVSLYDFVNRKVLLAKTDLEFLDNYTNLANQSNIIGLFEP